MARVVREPGYEDTTLDLRPRTAVAAPPPPVVVRETPVADVREPSVAVVDDRVTRHGSRPRPRFWSVRFPVPSSCSASLRSLAAGSPVC